MNINILDIIGLLGGQGWPCLYSNKDKILINIDIFTLCFFEDGFQETVAKTNIGLFFSFNKKTRKSLRGVMGPQTSLQPFLVDISSSWSQNGCSNPGIMFAVQEEKKGEYEACRRNLFI